MGTPAISVVIPVYNGARHLPATLESVLAQTFGDFELLVIDDGSTDATADLVRAVGDSRIRLRSNSQNRGISYSANRGMDEARGKYMARVDGDDIQMPHRLEAQWNFMEATPEIAVCGGWLELMENAKGVLRLPAGHDFIKAHLPFYASIAQPSSFFRLEFMKKHRARYDLAYAAAEDYDLWYRLTHYHGAVFANIQDVLVRYRVHGDSTSMQKKRIMRERAEAVRRRHFQEWGLAATRDEMRLHSALSGQNVRLTHEGLEKARAWLMLLRECNERQPVYASLPWRTYLAYSLLETVKHNLRLGPWACKLFFSWPDSGLLGLTEEESKALLLLAVEEQQKAHAL